VEKVGLLLSDEKKKEIEEATGGQIHESDKTIYVGTVGGKLDGYAVITNEIGKFEFITFIVKVTPKMEIEKVGVMVYRESRGGEIARKRFQQQYHGKKKTDPFRINHDIINITGATMSVRAMNRGIRKVFLVLEHYLKNRI
jgi:Na+-translocating ferredoxin:NAD+ oxidoreductase RnfG subunit